MARGAELRVGEGRAAADEHGQQRDEDRAGPAAPAAACRRRSRRRGRRPATRVARRPGRRSRGLGRRRRRRSARRDRRAACPPSAAPSIVASARSPSSVASSGIAVDERQRARGAAGPRRWPSSAMPSSPASGRSAASGRPARASGLAQRPERLGHLDRLADAGHEGGDGGVGREGHGAGDALDQEQAERVHVGLAVDRLALRLLGRGVAGGAEHGALRLGPRRLGQGAGQAEVGDRAAGRRRRRGGCRA